MGLEVVPEWSEDIISRLPNPQLSDTRYFAVAKAGAGDVVENRMFWELELLVLGLILRAMFQARGTCVSQAWARAVQFVNLVDMEINNEPEEWIARVHPGSIYGASRIEIGGGKIRGDGSIGAWAARAVTQYGVLYRINYDGWDLTSDSDELHSIEWGRTGVPDELEPFMREHPIQDVSLVTSGSEYLVCANEWKPVPVCSSRGFNTVRDRYGMCYPQGVWQHCMLAAGILLIKHPQYPSGRIVVPIYQSWGEDNPTGNRDVTLYDGREIKLPPGVFLVDLEVLDEQMLPRRDSFALFGSRGWSPIASFEKHSSGILVPA